MSENNTPKNKLHIRNPLMEWMFKEYEKGLGKNDKDDYEGPEHDYSNVPRVFNPQPAMPLVADDKKDKPSQPTQQTKLQGDPLWVFPPSEPEDKTIQSQKPLAPQQVLSPQTEQSQTAVRQFQDFAQGEGEVASHTIHIAIWVVSPEIVKKVDAAIKDRRFPSYYRSFFKYGSKYLFFRADRSLEDFERIDNKDFPGLLFKTIPVNKRISRLSWNDNDLCNDNDFWFEYEESTIPYPGDWFPAITHKHIPFFNTFHNKEILKIPDDVNPNDFICLEVITDNCAETARFEKVCLEVSFEAKGIEANYSDEKKSMFYFRWPKNKAIPRSIFKSVKVKKSNSKKDICYLRDLPLEVIRNTSKWKGRLCYEPDFHSVRNDLRNRLNTLGIDLRFNMSSVKIEMSYDGIKWKPLGNVERSKLLADFQDKLYFLTFAERKQKKTK